MPVKIVFGVVEGGGMRRGLPHRDGVRRAYAQCSTKWHASQILILALLQYRFISMTTNKRHSKSKIAQSEIENTSLNISVPR